MSFTYEYARAALAVDCVVFGLDVADLKVLLIQRKLTPFQHAWALPGGFVHMDETVDLAKLPLKYLSFSPCFRREIGAHAKDVKGLIRVHEFYKFEQVILCEASHEESVRLHEELTRNTEEYIESLGVSYHTVVNCGGDLGLGQVKKYDIELWVPGEQKYREIGSASYFHDFQTRRLNLRYKDAEGNLRYAHSLNNTAIPVPRILVSIVENYQQADGTIKVHLHHIFQKLEVSNRTALAAFAMSQEDRSDSSTED